MPTRASSKRKPETVIRSQRSELNYLRAYQAQAERLLKDRHAVMTELVNARDAARAEAAEWKLRFDSLLAAIPELRGKAIPEPSRGEKE